MPQQPFPISCCTRRLPSFLEVSITISFDVVQLNKDLTIFSAKRKLLYILYSRSHRFTLAHIAGICRRKILIEYFGEDACNTTSTGTCCDVCDSKTPSTSQPRDIQQELGMVLRCVHSLGNKGEKKVILTQAHLQMNKQRGECSKIGYSCIFTG